MDISFYKNIKINEVLSLTKKRNNYNHYCIITFFINEKYGSNLLFKKLIPKDKKLKEFDIERDMNEKEKRWFIEYHKKELINYIHNIQNEERTPTEKIIYNEFYYLVDGFNKL